MPLLFRCCKPDQVIDQVVQSNTATTMTKVTASSLKIDTNASVLKNKDPPTAPMHQDLQLQPTFSPASSEDSVEAENPSPKGATSYHPSRLTHKMVLAGSRDHDDTDDATPSSSSRLLFTPIRSSEPNGEPTTSPLVTFQDTTSDDDETETLKTLPAFSHALSPGAPFSNSEPKTSPHKSPLIATPPETTTTTTPPPPPEEAAPTVSHATTPPPTDRKLRPRRFRPTLTMGDLVTIHHRRSILRGQILSRNKLGIYQVGLWNDATESFVGGKILRKRGMNLTKVQSFDV